MAQGVPVIVTVVVLDRLWAAVADHGPHVALRTTLHTIVAMILVLSILSAE